MGKRIEGTHAERTLAIRNKINVAIDEATKCPKCGLVVYDWDACDAVKCSRCPAYFCGLCLRQCQNSPECHNHVKTCRLNTSGKNYFTDLGKECKRRRQEAAVRTILSAVPSPEL